MVCGNTPKDSLSILKHGKQSLNSVLKCVVCFINGLIYLCKTELGGHEYTQANMLDFKPHIFDY